LHNPESEINFRSVLASGAANQQTTKRKSSVHQGLKPSAIAGDDETKGNMALDKANIVEQLSNATVIEIADLVKELENKWGVTAAAPVAVAAAGGAAGGAAAPAEAKDTFDVILVSVPADKKIAAIKAVREVKAGLGLAEAKALVEGAPKPVLEAANKADSDAAKKKLEEAGAKVEVK